LDQVVAHVDVLLQAYPKLEGIQVLNDAGVSLFQSYRDGWMPDTAATRQAILDGLTEGDAFSDSAPSEGILAALELLEGREGKAAIYVYNADFGSSGSARAMLESVTERNRRNAARGMEGDIHSIALPVFSEMYDGDFRTAANFAAAMRELALQNGGRFIGLPFTQQGTASGVIALRGDVRFPGLYPVRRGETLRAVLARAGGLNDAPSADAGREATNALNASRTAVPTYPPAPLYRSTE
jgi:hypothetical protein